MMKEQFNESYRELDELAEKIRETRQRLAGLEQDAQQPRLATVADVPFETKTHKRTDDATANQAKYRDSCSAKRVDAGPPMCLTSFDNDPTKPPAHPCRDDAMVDKGAAAPKSCLSPVKIHTPTAAGGLLPACTASTATRTIFSQSLPS